MTTYEDNLLAVRFAALAPEPLPEDWDDVLDRAGAFLPHRPRVAGSLWRGGRRRVLVVVLAAAVLVAAVGTTAYGTVRVLFLDKGFIGLPPVGATPSAPESGELVVQWFAFAPPLSPQQDGKDMADMVRAWVYADGRIIWDRRPHDPGRGTGIPEGASELNSGYLEQRLAPEGVELVRAAAAELLERSRTLVEEIPAVEDPWWGAATTTHASPSLFRRTSAPSGAYWQSHTAMSRLGCTGPGRRVTIRVRLRRRSSSRLSGESRHCSTSRHRCYRRAHGLCAR
jgi:hypothetical protein